MAAEIQAQIEAQSSPQRVAPAAAPANVRPSMGGVRPSLRSGEGAPVGGMRPPLRSGEGAPVAAARPAAVPAIPGASTSSPGIPMVPGVPGVAGGAQPMPARSPAPHPQAAPPQAPYAPPQATYVPPQAPYAPPQAPYAPVSVPSGAPVEDDFLDRGRYDDVAQGPVVSEDIPGFVDSTLFKAFTPDVVETEDMEGLELTSYDDDGKAPLATEYVPVEHTAQSSVGAVQTEDIPGFVDSTLFKAFTPATVETEHVEGLEISSSAAATRPRPAKKAGAARDDDARPCSDCGSPHDKSACPSCGARRKSD